MLSHPYSDAYLAILPSVIDAVSKYGSSSSSHVTEIMLQQISGDLRDVIRIKKRPGTSQRTSQFMPYTQEDFENA